MLNLAWKLHVQFHGVCLCTTQTAGNFGISQKNSGTLPEFFCEIPEKIGCLCTRKKICSKCLNIMFKILRQILNTLQGCTSRLFDLFKCSIPRCVPLHHRKHLNTFKKFEQVLTNASRFWRNSIKVFEHFQRGCKGTRIFSGFPRKNAARCRFFSVKSRNSPQSVWCKGTHRGIEHLLSKQIKQILKVVFDTAEKSGVEWPWSLLSNQFIITSSEL